MNNGVNTKHFTIHILINIIVSSVRLPTACIAQIFTWSISKFKSISKFGFLPQEYPNSSELWNLSKFTDLWNESQNSQINFSSPDTTNESNKSKYRIDTGESTIVNVNRIVKRKSGPTMWSVSNNSGTVFQISHDFFFAFYWIVRMNLIVRIVVRATISFR